MSLKQRIAETNIIFRHCQKDKAQERKDCARYYMKYTDPAMLKPQTMYFYGRLRQIKMWREANPTFKKIKGGFCKHICAHCGELHKGEAWQ